MAVGSVGEAELPEYCIALHVGVRSVLEEFVLDGQAQVSKQDKSAHRGTTKQTDQRDDEARPQRDETDAAARRGR